MTRFSLEDTSVFLVVGSGAGGGTLSHELSRQGFNVVCLEAGRRLDVGEIVNDDTEMFGKMTCLDRRIGSGDANPDFPVWTCKTVGGSTMHWTAACPRLEPHEMRALSTYGPIEGTTLADWPVTPDEIAPWYDLAEKRMGVTGRHGMPMLPPGNNYKVLAAGARRCGYNEIDTHNMAINAVEYDERPACRQLGFCISGCAMTAKWSTLYTEIPKAEATGRFELRTGAMATAINLGPDGKAESVTYLRDGERFTQKVRGVAVAGNAIETARLLLNSRSDRNPDGVANSSGQVGRNYMRHFHVGVMGVMPGKVHFYRQTHLAGVVRDERHYRPERGFAGGFFITTVPFTPELLAKMMIPGGWGRELSSALEAYDRIAGLLIFGEDMPSADNRIALHPTEKDASGLPVPTIHYRYHPNTLKMRDYAWSRGKAIYQSLGAERVFPMGEALPATHNMGTARMGHDPKTSVCNAYGRTHDVSNLFVSDASVYPTVGCANPTLTLVALVLRQADHIVRSAGQGGI